MIITEEQIEEVLKKVKANYKYTKLNNNFVRTVLGDRLFMIDGADLSGTCRSVINPTKDFKIVIGIGTIYPVRDLRILQNDFELTDMEGRLDDKLSKQWQEGMIKRALPLQCEDFGHDARHYLADLRIYEFDKMANRVNSLCDMLAVREAEEQDD